MDFEEEIKKQAAARGNSFIKKHGCGCAVVIAVMIVVSFFVMLFTAPFQPDGEDGAKDPSFFLILTNVGALLIYFGLGTLFRRLKHCKIETDAVIRHVSMKE